MREAALHGLDGAYGLPHHFIKVRKLLAKGGVELRHKCGEHILQHVLYHAALIAAGSLNRTRNFIQR